MFAGLGFDPVRPIADDDDLASLEHAAPGGFTPQRLTNGLRVGKVTDKAALLRPDHRCPGAVLGDPGAGRIDGTQLVLFPARVRVDQHAID